ELEGIPTFAAIVVVLVRRSTTQKAIEYLRNDQPGASAGRAKRFSWGLHAANGSAANCGKLAKLRGSRIRWQKSDRRRMRWERAPQEGQHGPYDRRFHKECPVGPQEFSENP